MSYTSVERIVELPLDRLPINWSNVTQEALNEFQQYLEQSTEQQLSELEQDRRTVQSQIGKILVDTEAEHDGVSVSGDLLEQ
jgi:hypothetical protein